MDGQWYFFGVPWEDFIFDSLGNENFNSLEKKKFDSSEKENFVSLEKKILIVFATP
jgi:hypothetical protein